MNKKLLTTAIGMLLAGGLSATAMADVQLYGQLDLSINYVDPDAGRNDTNMESNQSAIGFKGSEDLGNGMNAFFKVEYQTNIAHSTNNGNGWTGRDQYIGLGSRFGKATLGTMSTAYKTPGSKIDVAYRSALQSRDLGLQSRLHAGKGENGQGRTTDTIRYDSPTFLGGAKVYGTYNLDQSKADKNNGGNDDDTYSIGAQYDRGNFYVAASYIDTQASDPSDTAAAQFLGKYTFGNFSVHGIYELDKGLITASRDGGLDEPFTTGGADDDGADIWSVGGTYTFGNNILLADYGQGSGSDGQDGISGTADDLDDYDVFRVGAIHSFSKRTLTYVGYALNSNDDNAIGDTKVFAVGARHNF